MSHTRDDRPGGESIRLGFIPLLDASPLIVARERGFFREEGLEVRLQRQTSWASLRDRVAVGLLEGAQMLGPMALAANLGLGAPASPLIAPLVLSRNGNAITVRQGLYEQLQATGFDLSRPEKAAQALARLMEGRREPIHVGIVYAWSSHYLQLRDWLASAGLHPNRHLKLVTVPPTQMLKALESGGVDLACVGEPWNSLAEAQGFGSILVSGTQIWQNAPEKVLGLRADWAHDHPHEVHHMLKALIRACRWLEDPTNHSELLDLLALPSYLDCGVKALGQPGHRLFHPRIHQYFFRQSANFPWLSQAKWLLSRMKAWNQLAETAATPDLQAIHQPDLYRQAAEALGLNAPIIDHKPEGQHEHPFIVAGRNGPVEVAADRLIKDAQ